MKIVEQLRYYRKAQGIKGKELAARSGLTSAMISKIENGWTTPTADTIERLADAMDCEVRVLPKMLPN